MVNKVGFLLSLLSVSFLSSLIQAYTHTHTHTHLHTSIHTSLFVVYLTCLKISNTDNDDIETIIYAASGKGILVTNKSDRLQRHELSAGDFAFVPPWTEHQELNETDEDVVWILIRSGPEPVVVWLEGWDGKTVKADAH